ncbi:MAG: hypothetical protein II611_02060 [Treponema sp.]|nr:hypothetical protein [Treponema sp.]
MHDFPSDLINLFIVCLELFFVCIDVFRFIKFQKQLPTKKETLRYLGFGLLRVTLFLLAVALASLVLSLIPYFYYWVGRNKELIEAIRPELNSDSPLFIFATSIFLFLFPVSVILAAILVIKKIRIALSLVFPMIAIFGFTSFLMLAFNDFKYYKNPLADTKVSESFKPLNLPLLKEGMTKEEVLNLLGDPIQISKDKNSFYYAEEGGYGEYWYFWLSLDFEGNSLSLINKEWAYED